MDPVRLREINALRPGDTTATGQMLGRDCSALRRAARGGDAHRLRAEAAGAGRAPTGASGSSLFFHGSGFTGGGEVKLASKASLELTRRRRAHPRGEHRDRPGHATMLAQIVADTLGRAVRQRRGRTRPTRRGARQRPDGRVAHLHDRRRAAGALRRTRCATTARALTPATTSTRHGPLVDHEAVRAAAGTGLGRRDAIAATPTAATAGAATSWRSRSIRSTLRGAADRSHRGARRSARRSHPVLARGPDRGRHGAGARLGAARGSRHARRRDGERAADQLHHPDDARHAADGRRHAREAVRARAVRREGRRRDADRRPGAGGGQRAPAPGPRRPGDSGDAGTDDGRAGQRLRTRQTRGSDSASTHADHVRAQRQRRTSRCARIR